MARMNPPQYNERRISESRAALRGISSMATRLLLAELAKSYGEITDVDVDFESVGGVDAARRVAADEVFDLVVLARDAIDKLAVAGHVLPESRVDLVHSGVAVAVPEGADLPDLSSVEALRAAVLAAPSIGYSTGPSGTQLLKLFDEWGLSETLKPKLKQAPAGVPVGALVARGEVALGFQQLSELIHQSGITVVGGLPEAVQINTVFSGAVCRTAVDARAAHELLGFMASADAAEAKRRQGMSPA